MEEFFKRLFTRKPKEINVRIIVDNEKVLAAFEQFKAALDRIPYHKRTEPKDLRITFIDGFSETGEPLNPKEIDMSAFNAGNHNG